MIKVILKKFREKNVLNGNPWIYSGAVEKIKKDDSILYEEGGDCIVSDYKGKVLGFGYFNPHSSITVRLFSLGNTPCNFSKLIIKRIRNAVEFRMKNVLSDRTDSCRLINSEGDFLPGLIVDKYNNILSVQFLTAGIDKYRNLITETLVEILKPESILDTSDSNYRKKEGLDATYGNVLYGKKTESQIITENGIKYFIDFTNIQKTGFFLDQRENRRLLASYTHGTVVLDCFSYTGAFALNALKNNAAQVSMVDSSLNALRTAEKNLRLNGFDISKAAFFRRDVFDFLKDIDENTYDIIILDPPKFAKTKKDIPQAATGYKQLNLTAIKKVKNNGMILTFSCSGVIDSKLFRQIVYSAAADSGRYVQLLHILSQPVDHPVNISHQEGEYLKGLALRVRKNDGC